MEALVALDLADRPEDWLARACAWGTRWNARLHLRTSSDEPAAEAALTQLFEGLPPPLRGSVARWGAPPEQGIAADAPGFDVVIMGSHRRQGLARWWFGSVAESAVRRVDAPVLVLRLDDEAPSTGPLCALCPVDAEEPDLGAARRLAAWSAVELHLVYAFHAPTVWERVRGSADDAAAWATSELQGATAAEGLTASVHALPGVEGDPSEALALLAGELGADVVALASHQRSGLERMVYGSVAEGLVQAAPCPVLVVPGGKAP